MKEKKLGIYIHMPFCAQKCSYCSFVSGKYSEDVQREYINALINELKTTSVNYKLQEVDTIYIGGGTPSMLFLGGITTVIEAVKKYFKVSKIAEITVEGNPNSLTVSKLREYKNVGVNRLSVGFQTYYNKHLKLLNRPHSKKDFISAIKNAKIVGFQNISADLLLGVPTVPQKAVKKALKLMLKLGVKHVSSYGLILEENTPIFKQIKEGKLKAPNETLSNKCYDIVLKTLTKKGFYRYEVSNFAINGFESKHNLKYWNLENYLGFGVSSHSCVDNVRYKNFDDVYEYINYYVKSKEENGQFILPKPKYFDERKIDKDEQKDEYIMLSLRTSQGISLIKFTEMFNEDLLKIKKKEIEELTKLKLIEITENNLKATKTGFEVLNQIILKLV